MKQMREAFNDYLANMEAEQKPIDTTEVKSEIAYDVAEYLRLVELDGWKYLGLKHTKAKHYKMFKSL